MGGGCDRGPLRALRASASLRIGDVADSCGVSVEQLERSLKDLPARGGCAAAAAAACAGPRPVVLAGVSHPLCPPPARRVAHWSMYARSDAAAGVSGWTRRSPLHPASQRPALMNLRGDENFKRWAATSPGCPPVVLMSIATAGELDDMADLDALDAAAEALRNPSCPLIALERGAVSEDWQLRAAVASNPNCSQRLLERLVAGVSDLLACDAEYVFEEAAKHRRCPPRLLAVLAATDLLEVRAGVAANPSCPPELLESLTPNTGSAVSGDSLVVARSVAANPSCPQDLLERLAGSVDSLIAASAACNPSCPTDLIVDLAAHSDALVRRAAGRHPACPPEVLQRLADDPDPTARAALCGAVNAPAGLLEGLANSPDHAQRSAAAPQPGLPAAAAEAPGRRHRSGSASERRPEPVLPAGSAGAAADRPRRERDGAASTTDTTLDRAPPAGCLTAQTAGKDNPIQDARRAARR